jgi:hypothetical protein
MCDPIKGQQMAGMATTAAGTYAAYSGAKAKGAAYRDYYNTQAQIAENNAKLAQMQGDAETIAAGQDMTKLSRRVAATSGAQRAGYGSSGIRTDYGTAADVLADTAQLGAEDALNLNYNTMLKTWALSEQAKGYENQAALDRYSGGVMSAMADMEAKSSLLSGLSSLGDQYQKMKGPEFKRPQSSSKWQLKIPQYKPRY